MRKNGSKHLSPNHFRQDVLTVVGNDKILLAADEEEEAVLIDSAVVAGLEPAVVECRGGCLGILVIASHDVGAADIYLADAVLIGIVYLYLVARKRSADAAGLMIFHGVGGNCRRALGYAVAVENLDAEVIEALLILGIERSAADNDILQISAELLMNLSEQLAADVDAELEKEAAYLDALLEDILSAGLSRSLPDALIDSLDNQRNTGEVLRMMGLEILNEVLYIYADIAVGDDDKRGEDSLHTLYGGDAPVDLSESIHDDTVSIPEEDQEIIRILRGAVQDYRAS